MFIFLFRRRCCGGSLTRFHNRWRSYATQTQTKSKTKTNLGLPWLMLSSPTNPEYRYLFNIVGGGTLKLSRKVHLPQISGDVCIGSSHGFLFSVPTCNSPDKIHAINPLNPDETLSMPSNTTLQAGPHGEPFQQYQNWKTPPEAVTLDHNYYDLHRSKAILSPSKDLLVLGRFSSILDLAYLGMSMSLPPLWTPLSSNDTHLGYMSSLDDLIFHKGFLYVADYSGNLLLFDPNNLAGEPFSKFAPDTDWQGGRNQSMRKSLVESPEGEDLFFLNRIYDMDRVHRTQQFEVFKLNRDFAWDKVESIGDLVMFVGHGANISLNARYFPNLRPNSIYFTDYFHDLRYPLNPLTVGDTGIFSLKDGTIKFFKLFDGTQRFIWPPPIWFAPPRLEC